jgi:hypothetical protein
VRDWFCQIRKVVQIPHPPFVQSRFSDEGWWPELPATESITDGLKSFIFLTVSIVFFGFLSIIHVIETDNTIKHQIKTYNLLF